MALQEGGWSAQHHYRNKPRDTRGGGEGAVGQGHTRYDCKITAMVVTNQRRDNTPTGGREALWGPPGFWWHAPPGPWGFALGERRAVQQPVTGGPDDREIRGRGPYARHMWDCDGSGDAKDHLSRTAPSGVHVPVPPVPLVMQPSQLDYRLLDFPSRTPCGPEVRPPRRL